MKPMENQILFSWEFFFFNSVGNWKVNLKTLDLYAIRMICVKPDLYSFGLIFRSVYFSSVWID